MRNWRTLFKKAFIINLIIYMVPAILLIARWQSKESAIATQSQILKAQISKVSTVHQLHKVYEEIVNCANEKCVAGTLVSERRHLFEMMIKEHRLQQIWKELQLELHLKNNGG